MRKLLVTCVIAMAASIVYGQEVYMLKSSKTAFFAGTPVEDIEAINLKASSFLNIKTGEIVINIPNKEFKFKRSLMQEHFNENYMETEKYPKSEFKGKIQDLDKYDFTKNEAIKVMVVGNLNIHGVTKQRTIEVTLQNNGLKINAETKFPVLLTDHNIERPKILWEKIAETIQVTSILVYEVYKK